MAHRSIVLNWNQGTLPEHHMAHPLSFASIPISACLFNSGRGLVKMMSSMCLAALVCLPSFMFEHASTFAVAAPPNRKANPVQPVHSGFQAGVLLVVVQYR